ncbi:MAG: hypothetical protein AAFN50_03805 [Pseudomonadota bacterium]
MSTGAAAQQPAALSIKRILYPLLAHSKAKQTLKWIVYSALVVNTGFYFQDDYQSMVGALPDNATLLDYVFQFATTLDMIAWLGLVFLFELETYAIEDHDWNDWVGRLIHGARVVCYIMIVNSAVGYTVEALETFDRHEINGVTSMCDMADQGDYAQISANEYPEITSENCAEISAGSPYYTLANEEAVVAADVVPHLQFMGILDIVNAYVWIIVVLLIELEVFLQSNDRFSSKTLTVARQAKSLLYLILIGNCVIWLLNDYYLYAWDSFLWIFGFWAIELNLAEWEKDRLEELHSDPNSSPA